MRSTLQKLQDKFQALSSRERVMVVVASLAVLVYLADTLLIGPEQRKAQALQEQLARESAQLQVLQQAIAQIRASRSEEVLAVERQRRDELQSEVMYARDVLELAQHSARAGGMARLVIAQLQGLTLRSLTIGAPQVFSAPKPPAAAQPAQAASAPAAPTPAAAPTLPTLYQHEVTFSVDGTYAQLLQFLSRLEAQSSQLFWPEAVLTVKQYPQLNLRATIHTLSIHQDAPLE